MILPDLELDKREVCPVHGWIGRGNFLRDRHDLCEVPLAEADVDDGAVAEALPTEPETVPLEVPPTPRGSRRRIPPKKTVAVRRLTRFELQAGRDELKALGADAPYARPKTRGDCVGGPRPCPFVACSMNLYLDVSETGSIVLNFPHLEPGQMPAKHSCALDLADRGGMTLEEIAVVTNLTRERIRQVELRALSRRALPSAVALGLGPEDIAAVGGANRIGVGQALTEAGVDGAVPSDVALLIGGDEDP